MTSSDDPPESRAARSTAKIPRASAGSNPRSAANASAWDVSSLASLAVLSPLLLQLAKAKTGR
ncbi:MAG: hypothetical protein IPG64_06210 [Haliea sp.]|nr:hypothetical protein [Haliea sp.]